MTYKYVKLVDWITEELNRGNLKPGQKLPTEAELTKRFGVSRHTVRQAIAFLENEGIVTSIQGSGTYVKGDFPVPVSGDAEEAGPADTGDSAGSDLPAPNKVVGLLISAGSDYIFPDIVQGASDYLMKKGYLLNVAFSGGDYYQGKESLEMMLEANPAGVIIEPLSYGISMGGDDIYEKVAKKVPTLMIHIDHSDVCPALGLKDREGTQMLTEYLLEMGHEKMGSIYVLDEVVSSSRYAGFRSTLYEHGIPHEDDNDIWIRRNNLNDLFQPEGSLALKRMLQDVTAIVCQDDRVACLLVSYLKKQGIRVPEDISVVGYDDSSYATLDLQITSVVHPKKKYGRYAARALLAMIKHPETFNINKYVIQPKLVIRDSVRNLNETKA